MDKMNIDTLLAEMDLRFKHFLFSRSLTPYIAEKEWNQNTDVGLIEIETAYLYREIGFNAKIQLDLENVNYEDWHDAGAWINKSFIVSLFALLDHWGVITYVRNTLKPIEGLDKDYWDLLYNLRHSLVHSSESFPIQKNDTSKNFREALRLQKKLFPLLLKDESKLNLDVKVFIIPCFVKLREILINQLSKYSEFHCNNEGKLTGVLIKKQGKA